MGDRSGGALGGGGGKVNGKQVDTSGGFGFGAGMSTGDSGLGGDAGVSGQGAGRRAQDAAARAGAGTDPVGGRGNGGGQNPGGRAPDSAPADTFLDSLLGYDTLGDRRTGYRNNPNRPGYDTSTMGIPINVPISEMISPTVFGNPVVDTLFNAGLTAIGATPISAGLAMTKGIQSATGMSGGPAPGGSQDNLGARPRTDAGPGDGQTGVARKAVAGAETNPTSATAPAGADQAQAEAPMVNPELAAILAENRRLASRRKTIMTGDIGAAQTTRKTVLGM